MTDEKLMELFLNMQIDNLRKEKQQKIENIIRLTNEVTEGLRDELQSLLISV